MNKAGIEDYLSYEYRIRQLKTLKEALVNREEDILRALELDMSKPAYEAYTSELGLIYRELDETIENLDKWMEDEKVKTPAYIKPGYSIIRPVPKGLVLIISPWNYPFLLSFSPLIGAMAAGNRIVLKPSNKSRHSQELIGEIIAENFSKDYIEVRKGPGSQVVEPLIRERDFQHIFFTGSREIGKKIGVLAAERLIPVSLELGGKSPVIVDESADIKEAARKIAWAKYFNLGQTCIAPDYALVHRSVRQELVDEIEKNIGRFYGRNPKNSSSYGRIISPERLDHLDSLIIRNKIISGGIISREELYISPTLVQADLEDPIMQEEIFGPILPIIEYASKEEIYHTVAKNPYPLALYVFTKNQDFREDILNRILFGGGAVNDLMSHMINLNLPFGGVRYSGLGSYHSKKTFDEFSHFKSLVIKDSKIDIKMKYPPYSKLDLAITKKFMS